MLLHPNAPDPVEQYSELTVVDPDTLRLETVPGFGSPGETVDYERADDGAVRRIRIGGGSAWPLADFRARRAAQVAAMQRPDGVS